VPYSRSMCAPFVALRTLRSYPTVFYNKSCSTFVFSDRQVFRSDGYWRNTIAPAHGHEAIPFLNRQLTERYFDHGGALLMSEISRSDSPWILLVGLCERWELLSANGNFQYKL